MDIIGIVIGLIFIYLIMSLICTAIREVIASWMSERAKILRKKIGELIGSGNAATFYASGLIKPLNEDKKAPSYIPAGVFAQVVYGIVGAGGVPNIRTALAGNPLGQALLPLYDAANGDVTKFVDNIEQWYDAAMERLGAYYKRRSQWVLLAIAIVVASAANVDTFAIADALSKNSELVRQLEVQARVITKGDEAPQIPPGEIAKKIEELRTIGVPLGWDRPPTTKEWPRKIIGLLLSALAMSLGAPFWFDLLKKFVNIRSSGQNPVEKKN